MFKTTMKEIFFFFNFKIVENACADENAAVFAFIFFFSFNILIKAQKIISQLNPFGAYYYVKCRICLI